MISDSPSRPKIDDNLFMIRLWRRDELTYNHINSSEPQPVSAVNERGSSLELVNEITEEVKFIWVVESFDTSLGDDTTTVCLGRISRLAIQ